MILIKIVVEEYINHISPYHLKLLADPTGFRNPRWYRQNWMAIEFNLLYRWHSLVPSSFRIGDRDVSVNDTLFNTDILVERGLGACFEDASNQRAGRVGLFNSPPEVWEAEVASVAAGARGQRCGHTTSTAGSPDFLALNVSRTSRATLASSRACGTSTATSTQIEFYPGLFAEDVRRNAGAPAAHRPDGRDRRLLASVHEPAALPAGLQPARRSRRSAGS